MISVSSKRHILMFYGILPFVFIFGLSLGTLPVFFYIELLQEVQQPSLREHIIPFFSLFIYAITISFVYSYWKNSPKIAIDKHSLKIGEQELYIKDITEVILNGKIHIRFIRNYPMEGTIIRFNNGTEKKIYSGMYSNSHEIKSFLEQVVLNQKEYKPLISNKLKRNVIRFESEETFKGNQLTSFAGIILWGLIGFMTILGFNFQNLPTSVSPLIYIAFAVFWFILHSWQMHYFGLTKDFIVVRNHNFVWKLNIYRLSEIKEVVLETHYHNAMRIVINDFKNYFYPAGTLRKKTWFEFKERLEAKGVIVRNELDS